MKFILAAALITVLAVPSFSRGSSTRAKSTSSRSGQVRVKGYTKKNGKYVAPHVRTRPNKTKADNYSTKGQVNPETGKPGTKIADQPAKTTP